MTTDRTPAEEKAPNELYLQRLIEERDMYVDHLEQVVDQLSTTDDKASADRLKLERAAIKKALSGELSEKHIDLVRRAVRNGTLFEGSDIPNAELYREGDAALPAPPRGHVARLGNPPVAGYLDDDNLLSAGERARKENQKTVQDKTNAAHKDAKQAYVEANPEKGNRGWVTYLAWIVLGATFISGFGVLLGATAVGVGLGSGIGIGLGLMALGLALLPVFNLLRDWAEKDGSFLASLKKNGRSLLPVLLGVAVLTVLLVALKTPAVAAVVTPVIPALLGAGAAAAFPPVAIAVVAAVLFFFVAMLLERATAKGTSRNTKLGIAGALLFGGSIIAAILWGGFGLAAALATGVTGGFAIFVVAFVVLIVAGLGMLYAASKTPAAAAEATKQSNVTEAKVKKVSEEAQKKDALMEIVSAADKTVGEKRAALMELEKSAKTSYINGLTPGEGLTVPPKTHPTNSSITALMKAIDGLKDLSREQVREATDHIHKLAKIKTGPDATSAEKAAAKDVIQGAGAFHADMVQARKDGPPLSGETKRALKGLFTTLKEAVSTEERKQKAHAWRESAAASPATERRRLTLDMESIAAGLERKREALKELKAEQVALQDADHEGAAVERSELKIDIRRSEAEIKADIQKLGDATLKLRGHDAEQEQQRREEQQAEQQEEKDGLRLG